MDMFPQSQPAPDDSTADDTTKPARPWLVLVILAVLAIASVALSESPISGDIDVSDIAAQVHL